MSKIYNHLVVSGGNNEITLKWKVQNPFITSVPSYSRIESTKAEVFGEDWYFVIKSCVQNLLYTMHIRRENVKDINAKKIWVNFKVKAHYESFSKSRYIKDNITVSSDVFIDKLRFRNLIIIKIICTATWCNPPSSEPQKPGQESFENRQDLLKLTMPKGQELLGSSDFHELLVTRRNADVHIDVKGQIILAHQSVLEARCPVLAAILSHNMGESLSRVITVTDYEPAPFEDFLVYIYTGKGDHIKGSNASDLYKISDKYDQPELKELCKKHILNNVSSSTFLDTLSTADMYNESEMLESAMKYFIQNGSEIIKTKEWQDFVKEHPNLLNKIFEKLFQMDAFASKNAGPPIKRRRKIR